MPSDESIHAPLAQALFVQGTSWVARAIQTATQSPFSHVGFVFGDQTYEADIPRVVSRDLRTYPWPHSVRDIRGMDLEKSRRLQAWCDGQFQRRASYDFGAVLGFFLDLCLHTTQFRSILSSRRAFQCAEFVWEGLAFVGLQPNGRCEEATPASLAADPLFLYRGDPTCQTSF